MAKLLIFAVVAVVGWLLIKGLFKQNKLDERDKPRTDQSRAPQATAEKMVKCSRCGVFLPESESMQRDHETMCRDPDHCLHRQQS